MTMTTSTAGSGTDLLIGAGFGWKVFWSVWFVRLPATREGGSSAGSAGSAAPLGAARCGLGCLACLASSVLLRFACRLKR